MSAIGAYQKINYTQSAVDLITKILSEGNIDNSEISKDKIKFNKEIIFKNVSFKYNENQADNKKCNRYNICFFKF